jgi:adsorption protein B
MASTLFPERYIFAPPLADDSALWTLFYINILFLINRLLHRHFWTCRIYGWSQLPLIIPRYVVANIINYLAVTRAIARYLGHLRTGEPIGWDKTTHSYPDEKLLAVYRRKLGDVLIERGLVTREQLERGLEAQAINRRPLGTALVDIGVLSEDVLIDLLCGQLRLARASAIDLSKIPMDLLRRLPQNYAKAHSLFPIEEKPDGGIALACAAIPYGDCVQPLEAILGTPLEFRLARRNEIAFALRYGYARLSVEDEKQKVELCPHNYRPFGELLIDMGAITYPDLLSALIGAAQSGRRVGEHLLAEGRIREEQVVEASARQRVREQLAGPDPKNCALRETEPDRLPLHNGNGFDDGSELVASSNIAPSNLPL